MRIVSNVLQMQKLAMKLRKEGKSIGFVPTMGALHRGHLSLIRRARRENNVVVVSIFVNPTQFGPREDFRRYPRNLKRDAEICKKVGVDYIFAPSVKEMYPEGYVTYVNVEGYLTETLEGNSRPRHFRGVVTVVAKLFNIVQPDRAYFGEKDYQQLLVIEKMVADLNLPVKIIPCPLVREKDGLAMSSRNVYLSPEQRKAALVLNKALKETKKEVNTQRVRDSSSLKKIIKKIIQKEQEVKLDYVAICDGKTLKPARKIDKGCVILVAARVGKTRLIDNVRISTNRIQET